VTSAPNALYAIPAARRLRAGAAVGVLAVALFVAGLSPLIADAPAWLRIAGVLLVLLGGLLALICAGLLNTVRQERAHRRHYEAEIAADRAAAQILVPDDCERHDPTDAAMCGADGCGEACALAALRRA
jgi:ABC-type nickel/cobalt efflux system permease component RcnA